LLPTPGVRRFWPLLAVPLGALAIAALAGVLRREAVSSTPGQVVSDFLGQVVRDRFEKATPFLTEGGEGSRTPAALKEWKQSVEAGLGTIRRVRGETDWISGQEAEATGILVAKRRERRLRFALERESGRWRIARLDRFWGGDNAPVPDPGPIRIREDGRGRPSRTRQH
jgi:hypothetical protein